MTKFSLLLAQAAPAPSGPSALMQFAPLLLLFGAMYFLMIAPQRKKQKEHEKMMSALQAGDEIITTPITDMGAITPILYQTAIPVFADVDPLTYNVTAETIERKITRRTRAGHVPAGGAGILPTPSRPS